MFYKIIALIAVLLIGWNLFVFLRILKQQKELKKMLASRRERVNKNKSEIEALMGNHARLKELFNTLNWRVNALMEKAELTKDDIPPEPYEDDGMLGEGWSVGEL